MLTRLCLSLFDLLQIVMPPALADPMAVEVLKVISGDAEHIFTVEVADDAEEISYGLMDRNSLDADKGMLFEFTSPRIPSMYMKNTLISLDMLFINSEGGVEMIARNTVPGSLRTISPPLAVKAVLEINGGLAATLGIEPGDRVEHPLFGGPDTDAAE